ncbi:MAG: hypothetical protein Q9186_002737 [Xanthomendoza sp. 1 TL-2023]
MGSYDIDSSSFSEDHGPDIAEPNRTLHQTLMHSAQQHPGNTALVSCHQPQDLYNSSLGFSQYTNRKAYLRWSYRELEVASETFASKLISKGICKGDAIVVVIDSCAEWALSLWAAARLACPFVPLNPAIVSRANEIQHILSALGRIGALIARDESIAQLLSRNAPAEVGSIGIKILLDSAGMSGYIAFGDALAVSAVPRTAAVKQTMDDPVLIVLTSGTTTLPKGCIHSNSTVASACERHKIIYWLDETRKSCNHMPLFHLAGVMESPWAWAHGGTVVYPNKSFDAHATLEAIDKERCTDMSLVSSMLCALTDHPVLPNTNTSSLQLIKFNANAVTGSVARASHEMLHARTVTNAFGMTETSCMTNVFAWKEGVCKDFEPFPVGCIAPGAKVRICAPGSHHPVKRGVIGELHLGGSTIADGYIGGSDDGAKFYSDEAGIWHVSGDQAIMAATGEITVLGRYKDVINRAGENISPSVLERVLNGVEGVQSAHVVGIPDEVAGEVPVAVIKMTEGKTVTKSLLHERVVKVLGTAFALERVIDLKELAVDDWPTTATAKVRKVDLREQVLQHLRAESKPSTQDTVRSSTEIVLTRIWARFTGIPEGQIAPTMSLKGIVDSVTVIRFRSRAKKELGRSLTLNELNANSIVAKQAAILDQQQESLPYSETSEDISKRLNDPGRPLPPRPKYSLFANSYHNYRSSVPAQLNIEYFASRLRGISQRRGALWPPKSSKSVNGPPERHAHHLLLKGNITPGLTGISKDIKLDMASNQYLTVHKIPHVIALKAAVAIYNTQQTGQPYAIIGTTHMARSYPFLHRHITDHLPDIMDMPGCTLERPLSNLYLDPAATLSTILHSLHADQLSQSAHVRCPVFALRDRLPTEDAAFLANDVEGRQSFNYNPVITPDPNMPLKNIQFAGNANISIIWWCGMVNAETVKLRITWNEEVFGLDDAKKAMEGFERNLAWIVDGANWEKRLGERGE